jgi:type II secretion system protein G
MNKRVSGFTIVELLVVIVVIAILAAITIVAYNGIQARARDSERSSEMQTIEKALALYFVDNGGYPNCSGGTYAAGSTPGGCGVSALASALVPKYISTLPADPKNSGNDVYQYAFGYKKTSTNGFTGDASNNYITGMHLETVSGNVNGGWVSPAYYNYLGGSSN